mgnify:CR=1 FL=1
MSWVTNRDDSTGSARTMGGGQKVTITVSSRMVLTWLVDLAAVPSKRTGVWVWGGGRGGEVVTCRC